MDAAYALDWANLLLRWAHVVVAIAWIGASFYFVFLDLSLTPPTDAALRGQGVAGELWAVHGGGFYRPQKYLVAPATLPGKLHWFYWESYSTWLTGVALWVVLYVVDADTFLVDRNVHAWSGGAAAAASFALLAAFWVVYDAVCRAFGERRHGDAIVGVLVFAMVVAAAWVACSLFAARAAWVLVGAMLATAMTANVFFWIIPGQRTVVAQMRAKQTVDPVHGRRAKQRSVHNTYFTLPVIVAMLSNHYGWLTQGPHAAATLVASMLAGALIRHSFVARHAALVAGRRVPWGYAVVGAALIVGLAVWRAPARVATAPAVAAAPVTAADVGAIVARRCVVCHNAQVRQKEVMLHTPELLARHAAAVYQQTVRAKTMPLNNATAMTDDERDAVRRWFEGGAAAR